jgi:serine/threonine protein kinase
MGAILGARDLDLCRRVAMKVILDPDATPPEGVLRFVGEAQVGSARDGESSGVLMTLDGAAMGTPQFMAPEQALGKVAELDARTDLYALGAILYNLLALQPPVQGATLREVMDKVTSGRITPPAAMNATVSRHRLVVTPSAPAGRRAARPWRAGNPAVRWRASVPRRQSAREPSCFIGGVPRERAEALTTSLFPHCRDGRIPPPLSAVAMKALALDPAQRYQTVKDLQAVAACRRPGGQAESRSRGTARRRSASGAGVGANRQGRRGLPHGFSTVTANRTGTGSPTAETTAMDEIGLAGSGLTQR